MDRPTYKERSHKLWRVDICTSSCITLNSQHSLPVSFVCRPPVVDSAKPDAGFRERPVRLPGLRPQRGVGRLAEHLLQLLVGLRRHHRRVRRRDKAVGGGRGLLLHHIPWRAHARECVCLLCARVRVLCVRARVHSIVSLSCVCCPCTWACRWFQRIRLLFFLVPTTGDILGRGSMGRQKTEKTIRTIGGRTD